MTILILWYTTVFFSCRSFCHSEAAMGSWEHSRSCTGTVPSSLHGDKHLALSHPPTLLKKQSDKHYHLGLGIAVWVVSTVSYLNKTVLSQYILLSETRRFHCIVPSAKHISSIKGKKKKKRGAVSVCFPISVSWDMWSLLDQCFPWRLGGRNWVDVSEPWKRAVLTIISKSDYTVLGNCNE